MGQIRFRSERESPVILEQQPRSSCRYDPPASHRRVACSLVLFEMIDPEDIFAIVSFVLCIKGPIRLNRFSNPSLFMRNIVEKLESDNSSTSPSAYPLSLQRLRFLSCFALSAVSKASRTLRVKGQVR